MTTTSSDGIVDRLAALPNLSDVPREQLEWLVEHGEIRRHEDRVRFYGADDLVGLVLLVSGRFSVRVEQHGIEREVREITPGRPTGHLPYSRMTKARGYLVADGPVEFVFLRKDRLPEMTRACYELTEACVQEMLARVRVFKAEDKHQEKMAALGRLSAGLAHELNNPASAVLRAARELDAGRAELAEAARALGATGVSDLTPVLRVLRDARRRLDDDERTAVDRANDEDEVMDWLERHGLETDLAYPLNEQGLTVADLEAAATETGGEHLRALVRYAAAEASGRALSTDALSAATRIHALVSAVKKHTHMDRAPTVERIHLGEHLADAVTLLRSKASLKDATLDLIVDGSVPPVTGTVADLNQVWMHLIDNAIDAVGEGGRISIEAAARNHSVVVRVVDNGPGVADDDRDRIFEPFFTTKDVRQGRGLGLDIVRTVVHAHRGAVDLTSLPGRTEFRVTLPVSETPE